MASYLWTAIGLGAMSLMLFGGAVILLLALAAALHGYWISAVVLGAVSPFWMAAGLKIVDIAADRA